MFSGRASYASASELLSTEYFQKTCTQGNVGCISRMQTFVQANVRFFDRFRSLVRVAILSRCVPKRVYSRRKTERNGVPCDRNEYTVACDSIFHEYFSYSIRIRPSAIARRATIRGLGQSPNEGTVQLLNSRWAFCIPNITHSVH